MRYKGDWKDENEFQFILVFLKGIFHTESEQDKLSDSSKLTMKNIETTCLFTGITLLA